MLTDTLDAVRALSLTRHPRPLPVEEPRTMRESGSATARTAAFCRAMAGVDSLAAAFIGPRGRQQLRFWRRLGRWGLCLDRIMMRFIHAMGARTVYFDARIEEALATGIDQVVLLGAGFDTRVWRLPRMAEASVFLVDHPHTAAARQRKAAQLPAVGQRVDVDFAVDDVGARLIEAGFDPSRPAVLLWEGVSMYLDRAVVRDNLVRLRALAAPGSRLLFDAWNSEATGWRTLWEGVGHAVIRWLGEPIVFDEAPQAVAALCRETGWSVRDCRRSREVDGYGEAYSAEVFFELATPCAKGAL